jgi:hypothetical protein
MDYHGPLAGGFSAAPALDLIRRAEQLRLDRHGASLELVQMANGQLGIEARLLQSQGPASLLRVFSLDHPDGEERALDHSGAEELQAFLPHGAVILTAEDLQAAANTTLDSVFAAAVTPADWLPISLCSKASSLRAGCSPSAISPGSRTSVSVSDSDFLPRRSQADGAGRDTHRGAMPRSQPRGAGDGIMQSVLSDGLFGSA